jgi:GNAT superfamily N-acetyltransferase
MAFTIKTFDSDLDRLYSMMDAAWAKDYHREPRLDYTPEFLRWHFEAPGADAELLVGAYQGEEIIGFGSSFHRSMYLRGEPVRTTMSTFFTTHADYRRQGVGWSLVEERLRRNREKGYQCTFVYLQEGHASEPLYRRYGEEKGVKVELIYRCPLRVRILDTSKLSARGKMDWSKVQTDIPAVTGYEGDIRPYRDSDLPRCRELLNDIRHTVPFARVWESDGELAWQLRHPPFSDTLVMEVGGRVEGLINYFSMPRIAKTVEQVAMMDNIWFGSLDGVQISALIAAALSEMKERGCIVANFMGPPCMDETVFRLMGFVEYPTYLNLYAVMLDPSIDLSGLELIYLDQR